MKNLYNNREDELVNHLKSFEANPPDGLWDDIEATLRAENKRRIYITVSWASAAAIAMLFTIGGIYSMNHRVDRIVSKSRINSSSTTITIPKTEVIERPLVQNIKTGNTENQRITSNRIASSITRKRTLPSKNISLLVGIENLSRNEEIPETLASVQPSIRSSNVIAADRIDIKSQDETTRSSSSIAQVEEKKKRLNGIWYISASGFPVYSFHTAGAMNKSGTQQEAGIVTWGGSMTVRYAFSKTLSIETGLTYNIIGQQEKNINLVASNNTSRSNDVVTYTGFSNSYGQLSVVGGNIQRMDLNEITIVSLVSTTNYRNVIVQQRFSYLEVPVLLAKVFHVKGIGFNLKGGLSAGFLIGNKLDLKCDKLHLDGRTNGVDPFVASALASFGISYPVMNHINLLIEPTFKLGLKSLSTETGKSYPFSTYIKFGIEVPI